MEKKLFVVFGPAVLAFGLPALSFISSYRVNIDNPKVIKRASPSMSANVLKGDAIRNKALSGEQYIPFFGSSELNRINPLHPPALAEEYDRGYRPFLLGAPGTQPLSQYMMTRSAGDGLKSRRVVFIISPQWFVKDGIRTDYFNIYYSEFQTYD